MKQCQFCANTLRTCSESRSGVCEDCQIAASTSRSLYQNRGNWMAKISPECHRTKELDQKGKMR